MATNIRRQVEQAVRSVLPEVRQIAPQIIEYRVISPFAADNAFVVYYVLANRQEFQATVAENILPKLQELVTSELARYPDVIGATVDLVAQEDLRDIDAASS
jgi:hypothetical protein